MPALVRNLSLSRGPLPQGAQALTPAQGPAGRKIAEEIERIREQEMLRIISTPGVVGGRPRIGGRRITVQQIAIWYEQLGLRTDEIATEYGLTLRDIYAALTYYYDHREEIDRSIHADSVFAAEMQQQTKSRVRQ